MSIKRERTRRSGRTSVPGVDAELLDFSPIGNRETRIVHQHIQSPIGRDAEFLEKRRRGRTKKEEAEVVEVIYDSSFDVLLLGDIALNELELAFLYSTLSRRGGGGGGGGGGGELLQAFASGFLIDVDGDDGVAPREEVQRDPSKAVLFKKPGRKRKREKGNKIKNILCFPFSLPHHIKWARERREAMVEDNERRLGTIKVEQASTFLSHWRLR